MKKSNFKQIFLTLALLITAATGAWADGEKYTVQFKANGNTKTVENVTLPHTFWCSYDSANGVLDQILKELYGWTGDATQTFCDNTAPSSDDASKATAGKDGDNPYITISNAFEGTVTVAVKYWVNENNTPYSLEISISDTAPAAETLEVTLDEANKVATMKMPASDVTVEYSLVRDLAQQVTFGGIPTGDGLVVKNNGTAYEFVTAPAFTLTDALNGNADIISDGDLNILAQKKGENDQWETKYTSLDAFLAEPQPGTWHLVAEATEEGAYDGTVTSADFTLAEKYDLLIQPADEYSKGKLSEVTVAGTAQTLDTDGKATVTNVAPGAEVKLKANRGYVIESVEAKKPGPQTLSEATTNDIGKLICTDGHIHALGADAECTKDRVAMIAYVGSETDHATYTHGLAIALTDESGTMYWSTAKNTCEGKTAVTGAAWLLPSQNQWEAMFKAIGNNKESYTGLNMALADVGGDSSKLQESGYYWSSTELDPSNRALYVNLVDGGASWDGGQENVAFNVRAVLAF